MKKSQWIFSAAVTLIYLSISTNVFAQNTSPFWSLTGNNNATGNSKLGTTNSIPIRFFTNNFERVRIDANGRVGIGTTTPVNLLTVKLSGSTPSASWLSGGSSPAFLAFAENMSTGFNLATASDIFNHRPVLNTRRSRGTLAFPSVVANNDFLASFVASGYDGSGFQNPATIDFYVDSTPTAGNVPGRIAFVTGSNVNNRMERLKIGSTGNITFNNNQLFLQKSTGALGLGTTNPNTSAILDIQSTTKGILTSRMTQAQRNAILNPAVGLLIFQTDGVQGFYYYNGSWQPVAASGNNVTGANTALSNLGFTAINTHLLPGFNTSLSIGSPDLPWKDIHISGTFYKNGEPFINTPNMGTFLGIASGNSAVSGQYNDGFGLNTLRNVTSGERNTAIGAQSLFSNTTGYNNVALGLNALYFNSAGFENTAIGNRALEASKDYWNTAVGCFSMVYSQTGVGNTGVGFRTLLNNFNTSYNTAVGNDAGYNSASQGTFLGANATSFSNLTNVTAIGYNAFATADNQVSIGNTLVTSIGGQVGWTAFSDGRFKKTSEKMCRGLNL